MAHFLSLSISSTSSTFFLAQFYDRKKWSANFFFCSTFLVCKWSSLIDFLLGFTQAQYHDWIKLLEVVSRYKTYVEVSHLRPVLPVSDAPHLWWPYAAQSPLQQKQIW
jgi:hypothetical protein